MTIAGQQTLLDEEAPDRYLACRNCGEDIEVVGMRSIDHYVGTCEGGIEVENGELRFEGGGYTEIDWDSADEKGFQCDGCDTEKATLEELVEWRVRNDAG